MWRPVCPSQSNARISEDAISSGDGVESCADGRYLEPPVRPGSDPAAATTALACEAEEDDEIGPEDKP